jgi:lipopolysaccharide transport system permease protein
MSRVVYTSEAGLPTTRLLAPHWILRNLLRHRELISAYAKREFQAAHRGTYLGLMWALISPLIMLALFTMVFGYIFKGRFTQRTTETPAEFALALFVGLSLFNCLAQSLGGAPSLVAANSVYVKTLVFPLEILPVAAVANVLVNLGISLGLCIAAFFAMYGYLHWSAICLVVHVACIALLSLGVSWFVSSLSVFVRDVPAIIPPVSLVLMFASSVFFPLSAVPAAIRRGVQLNPLAIIIDQARGCFLYGQWPAPFALAVVAIFSGLVAVLGYWFFMRAKPAFADVL